MREAAMRPAIAVDQLTKIYPPTSRGGSPFTAVDKISFEVAPGEVVGLLGPNGAGKSTTISMLLGVLTPTSGTIRYNGKDLETHRSEILSHVTFSSTYIRMPWRLSVMENLRIYGYLYGLNKDQFEHRAEKFLSRFGVWEQRNKTMNNLSAGQVTRVMLAKAFIPHPTIALLDEPTASLDPEIAHQIRIFVKEQQKEFKTTMIYTSHNMDEVTDLCDRVIFLKEGKIVAQDTPENLAQGLGEVSLSFVSDVVGLKKLIKLAKLPKADIDGNRVKLQLHQSQVATYLAEISRAQINFSDLEISKPDLENYFLHLVGVKK